MVPGFLKFRHCLSLAGFCVAWTLTGSAQTPQKSQPAPTPVTSFCEAPQPARRGGVGTGSGSATASEEVKEVFTQSQVTKKAEVLFKPELGYSASGSEVGAWEIKLRVVLCPRGYVSNIEIHSQGAKKVPDAFTEKAVEAARNIRFIPAEKDGKRVAQYLILVYSYEVY
ncbi:MAG: hypothetical protein QOE33_2991 [Acidobacteriota bacterium]|nr:hypothetical protein [Acidobacteriota bacterium]